MDGYALVSEVPVRFSDTDGLGHVNNANYLSFLEVARVDYLHKVLGLFKIEEFGIIIARSNNDQHGHREQSRKAAHRSTPS